MLAMIFGIFVVSFLHGCSSEYTLWTDDFHDLDNWVLSRPSDPHVGIYYEPYNCPSNNAPCLLFKCNETCSGLTMSTSIQTSSYKDLEISFNWLWHKPTTYDHNTAVYYSCGADNTNEVRIALWDDYTSVNLVGTEYYSLPGSCDGQVVNLFFQCHCSKYSPFGLLINGMKLTAQVLVTSDPTKSPTNSPTQSPTNSPTNSPTKSPTNSPTKSPTNSPITTTMYQHTNSATTALKKIEMNNTGYVIAIVILAILFLLSIFSFIWMKFRKSKAQNMASIQLSNEGND